MEPTDARSRPATMADVGRRVGVSRQLVGLVFRNEDGVGAATRRKILDAAGELGYSPNIAARSLRRPSTKHFGVLFDPGHSAPVEIISWLYAFAHAAGYALVLSALSPERDESDAIAELLGHRCEALILIAPRSTEEDLRSLTERMPVVLIGRQVADAGCDTVRSAGDQGIGALVQHLAELGHSDIVYVDGSDMLDSQVRRAGYERGMRRLSLAERVLTIPGDYTEESGATAARLILESGALPTAIVCNNDQAALGLTHTLLKAGVRIPQDVSVTGFDDSRIASLSFLDLTTARQDPREVGEAAIAAALARVGGSTGAASEVITSANIVVRGSTAAPRH
jgi:DNA-binding LacI/PurR family transcriptional regulator